MKTKHPLLISLGQKIRELRKSQGYSQEAFADKAGLDRTYMGGIERGERNITILNLYKIAVALKIHVGDLFPSNEIH